MTVRKTDSFRLTEEQALSLGKGPAGRRQIRSMAGRDKWLRCGRMGASIWGEYAVRKHAPLQVQCDLVTLTVRCTCTTRVRPCNHGPALILYWLQQPGDFVESCASTSAAEWWAASPLPSPLFPSLTDSLTQPEWGAVMRGLGELELWLHDLMRAGLAGLPEKPKTDWLTVADRLADAHLDELARTLKRLSTLPGTTAEWPEILLVELGKLHLMIQAFKKWDELSPQRQGDLRLAVGRLDDQSLAADSAEPYATTDCWQVVADERTQEGALALQRTWLWAEAQNQAAAVVHTFQPAGSTPGAASVAAEGILPVGVGLKGALLFYPATTPLRAHPPADRSFYQPTNQPAGYRSIAAAMDAYRRAITANPWQGDFPLLLSEMRTQQAGDWSDENDLGKSPAARWQLVDAAGAALPLTAGFDRGWHLRALGAGSATAIFGLWDGDALRPLSVWSDGRWLKLDYLRGIA